MLSELDLKKPLNEETKYFIESFINQYGGADVFKRELEKQKEKPTFFKRPRPNTYHPDEDNGNLFVK